MINVGIFCVYLQEYLCYYLCICQDMILMVCQLVLDVNGLLIEIYCFINIVVWVEYEGIQVDIFDYVFVVVDEFGLCIY